MLLWLCGNWVLKKDKLSLEKGSSHRIVFHALAKVTLSLDCADKISGARNCGLSGVVGARRFIGQELRAREHLAEHSILSFSCSHPLFHTAIRAAMCSSITKLYAPRVDQHFLNKKHILRRVCVRRGSNPPCIAAPCSDELSVGHKACRRAFIILFLKRGHEKWRVSLENYAPIQPHEFNDFVIWLCRAEPGETNNFAAAFLSSHNNTRWCCWLALFSLTRAQTTVFFSTDNKIYTAKMNVCRWIRLFVCGDFHFYIFPLDSAAMLTW
jgi:hypothetical protein